MKTINGLNFLFLLSFLVLVNSDYLFAQEEETNIILPDGTIGR